LNPVWLARFGDDFSWYRSVVILWCVGATAICQPAWNVVKDVLHARIFRDSACRRTPRDVVGSHRTIDRFVVCRCLPFPTCHRRAGKE
jgi:hypothetical protein